jgi:hypothetical protein
MKTKILAVGAAVILSSCGPNLAAQYTYTWNICSSNIIRVEKNNGSYVTSFEGIGKEQCENALYPVEARSAELKDYGIYFTIKDTRVDVVVVYTYSSGVYGYQVVNIL